jgi:hypothetical protein
LSLTGTGNGNYSLTMQSPSSATITAKALTESGLSVASSMLYDGTTSEAVFGTATLLSAETAGSGTTSDGKPYSVDSVSLTGTATGTYNSKDVATASTVTYGGLSLTGTGNGNYSLTMQSPSSATITAAPLTVTASNASKTYGQTPTLTAFTSSGLQNSETIGSVTETSAGTSATASVAGGPYTITPSAATGGTFTAGNYSITYNTGALTVNPASLTVTASNATKTYGQTPTLTAFTSSGLQNSETIGNVTESSSGTSATASVGSYSITPSAATGGTFTAGNYNITYATGSLTVNPEPLTLSGITASNKTYDGTTSATLNTAGVTYSGLVNGETVTLSGTGVGTFSDKNAANGKTVTVSGYTITNGTGLASNYTLAQPSGLTANITPAVLTASMTASNKTYDATVAATPTFTITGGLVGTETVSVSGTASFSDKNAGNGKTVTANTVTLANGANGGLASNYSLAAGETAAANITPASLSVTGVSASNKTYDATTTATLVGTAAVAALGSDAVTVGGTGSGVFADKNVGTGKAVTVTGYTLSGTDAGNYSIVQPTGLTANITPKALTVTNESATSKIYDGTTTATLSGGSLVGVISGDTVNWAEAGNFASKNVGNAIAVTASDTISGASAGNYTITQPSGLSANITPAPLTVSGLSGTNRTYNGSAADSLSGTATLNGLVNGETLILGNTTNGTLASANAGSEAVSTNLTISNGTGLASNYTLTQPALVNVTISPVTLTYTATPYSTVAGQPITGLSGTVTGFVGNENPANATTGNLAWSTTATSSSQPGQYDIEGSGLSAANYVFVEAQGNATALTLQPGSLPGNVQSITTQNDSNFTHLASQPLVLNPSTTITPTPTPAQPAASTGESSSNSGSGGNSPAVANTTIFSVGSSGSLTLINGGVNLGENVANQGRTTVNLNSGGTTF